METCMLPTSFLIHKKNKKENISTFNVFELPWCLWVVQTFFFEILPKLKKKKDVLRNFVKFTRKRLCQGLFFNKVAYLACHLILQNTYGGCFYIFCSNFCLIATMLEWLLNFSLILRTRYSNCSSNWFKHTNCSSY